MDEIKTVDELATEVAEAPKKRGRKSSTTKEKPVEVASDTKISEEKPAAEPKIEPEHKEAAVPVQEKKAEKKANTSKIPDEPIVQPQNDAVVGSKVVSGVAVYKTPNIKNYATTISGVITVKESNTDADAHGFIPVQYKIPGTAKSVNGFIRKDVF